MRLLASLTGLVLLLAGGSASAQEGEAAAPIEDRPASKLTEVEHGVFVGAEAGAYLLFSPDGANSGFSPGRSVGITIGTDVGERASIGLLVMGVNVDTPATYAGPNPQADGSTLRGDFSGLVLGALGKFAFWARPDDNGVNRSFAYVRGGVGLSLMSPARMFTGPDILVIVGPGYEVFTHLRHFSVGIEADFLFGVRNMKAGLMLNPSLRYTF